MVERIEDLYVLGRKVVKDGAYRQVKHWVKGAHPDRGKLLYGLSGGLETEIDASGVKPQEVIIVVSSSNSGSP